MGVEIVVQIPRVKYGSTGSFSSRIIASGKSSSGNSSDSDSGFSQYDNPHQLVKKSPSTSTSVYSLPKPDILELTLARRSTPESKAITNVQNSIIGEGHVFEGPFGRRRCLYLDQTASGRCVNTIEDFIQENVMPVYGNTHTTTSYCASQISAYREEAREIVKKYCGGGKDDEVIFCGSGATAAVHKLVNSVLKPGDEPPIVIIGPYEHHSNVLPWREVTRDVITISEDVHGFVNLQQLEDVLESIKADGAHRTIIGSFSAGSNVTGALTDDVAVTTLLHKYGALSFWDYAAAAPHVQIEMNPITGRKEGDKLARKDALFFSGHKFLGGPQTPGVLVVKEHVLRNAVPHGHGGGTVLFVTRDSHQYVEDKVERNEGGTPDIIGSIRLGLVLQMQTSVGLANVISREADFTRRTLSEWGKFPEILVLGHQHSIRLPIVSFMIQHLETGHFLHQDFVVALLNDLFGIQCRSGCMCAGPFAQGLLGMDENLARAYEEVLSKPRTDSHINKPEVDMVFKPGFVRMSLPYHASYEEINFSIEAVKWVAKNGWMLLPFYKMDVTKGTFRFNGNEFRNQIQRKPIHSFCVEQRLNLKLVLSETENHKGSEACLDFAQQLVESVEQAVPEYRLDNYDDNSLFDQARLPLRWFLLPSEALQLMKYPSSILNQDVRPFEPKVDYKIPTGKHKSKCVGSIPNNTQCVLNDRRGSVVYKVPIDGRRLQEGDAGRNWTLTRYYGVNQQ